MDDARFDTLTKSLTRRPLLRFLTGALIGTSAPLLGEREAVAGCRRRPCRDGTCQGCCTRRGCCKPGTSLRACGTGGEPCTSVPQCCTSNDCSGTLQCSGGVCGEAPDCDGPTVPCDFNSDECCSGRCTQPTGSGFTCDSSVVGEPCRSTAYCSSQAKCIGFYCGGCQEKGQPCGGTGVGCCDPWFCTGGVCGELDPNPQTR